MCVYYNHLYVNWGREEAKKNGGERKEVVLQSVWFIRRKIKENSFLLGPAIKTLSTLPYSSESGRKEIGGARRK